MKMRAIQWINDHFNDILHIKTSKQSIATGFAVGTFISILPIPGFSILIATAIVLIFKRVSKLAIFLAMAFWNPITLIPIYYYSYDVGMFLLKDIPTKKFTMTVLNRNYYFTNDFLIGNVVLALVIAGICHFAVYHIVKASKNAKKARQLKAESRH